MPVVIGNAVDLPDQQIVVQPSGDTTGATDQTNVSAAVSTLLAKTNPGGTIVLGGGDWYWNSIQINLYNNPNPARLKIVGQGQATRIHNTSTGTAGDSTATFYVYGGADLVPYPGAIGTNWIEIDDLELVGSAASVGIVLNATYQGRLSGIYAHGFTAAGEYGSGIVLNDAIEIVIEDPVITGCTNGIWLDSASNINNVVGGWLQNNSTAGAIVHSGVQNNFFGTVFQQCGTGVRVDINGGDSAITDCWFEGNSTALDISGNGTHVDSPYFNSGQPVTVASGTTGVIIRAANSQLALSNITDNTGGAGLLLRDNAGINPVGAVTVAVPSSGTAVAAAPYDRTFYVTAGSSTVTMAIENGPSPVIPASSLGTIHVPAGKTVTPTYTTAPTWLIEGN